MNWTTYISNTDKIINLINYFIEDGNYYKIFFWWIDYFPLYSIINHPPWNDSFLAFFIWTHWVLAIVLFIYTVLIAYIFRWISRLFKYQWFSFWWNEKYFHFIFVVLPIVGLLYGIILGFSNLKIHKQLKYILLGTAFWSIILFLRNNSWANWYEWLISPFYFSPIILLGLLLWKPLQNWKQISKYVIIIIIFLLLVIQPFFFTFFIDDRKPMESKVCYPRISWLSQSNHTVVWSQCFKIFEPFWLYPWMHNFWLTWEEYHIWKTEKELDTLERKRNKLILNSQNTSTLDKEIRYQKRLILSKKIDNFNLDMRHYRSWKLWNLDISKLEIIKKEYKKFIWEYWDTFEDEEFYRLMLNNFDKINYYK